MSRAMTSSRPLAGAVAAAVVSAAAVSAATVVSVAAPVVSAAAAVVSAAAAVVSAGAVVVSLLLSDEQAARMSALAAISAKPARNGR